MENKKSPFAELVNYLSKLPGIGKKSAERIVYDLINKDQSFSEALAKSIVDTRKNAKVCHICFNLTDTDPCNICSDSNRDTSVVCVVEEAKDVMALENADDYKGLYHVLNGIIDPKKDDPKIKLNELIKRVGNSDIKEVILAINPSPEGEMTATYIALMLKPFDVKITKIAYGLPFGGDMDYFDKDTLNLALNNRREI